MKHMYQALALAKEAAMCDEVPVGAVLVHHENVLAEAFNHCVQGKNALQHAEMLVLSEGMKLLAQPYLNECILYVTLEPCPMCAAAIAAARVKKVVFGAYDSKSGGVEHGARVFEHTHHKPEIVGGILEAECQKLLTEFFQSKR